MKKILSWLWHQIVAYLGHALGVIVTVLLLTSLKSIKDNETIAFYWTHPKELLSPAIITILLFLILGLITKISKDRKTMASFGVRLFSHHNNAEVKKQDWLQVCEDINRGQNPKSTLWILGATGKETFAAADAPLHDLLQTYSGAIRILLICPGSLAFVRRTGELKHSESDYQSQIADSLEYCQRLVRNHGRDLQVKLYKAIPIWKMILTNSVLWVQHYRANSHVDDTPMFCFEYQPAHPGLFDGFLTVFEKRWRLDDSLEIDLQQWSRNQFATPRDATPSAMH